jgi:predicted Zn finger-like uncharacterized protein
MLIVCPSCATSYMVDPASFGAAGRTVRCTRCKTSWFAGGPEAAPELAAATEAVTAEAESLPARTQTPPPPLPPADDPTEAEAEPAPPHVPAAEAPPVEAPATPVEPLAAPEEAQGAEPEPVTVTDAPPLAPPEEHEVRPDAAEAEPESDAAVALEARRRLLDARRKKSRRSSRWSAVVLVLIAFNVAVIGARNEVVRYLPQTASLFAAIGLPVNLRNLKFENVKLSTEAAEDATMLTVQGSIVSEAGKAVAVPRLRFAVRNASGQEVYTWTMAPPRSILEPGARLDFRSQIPVPKGDATDVLVRFLTAQDAGAK